MKILDLYINTTTINDTVTRDIKWYLFLSLENVTNTKTTVWKKKSKLFVYSENQIFKTSLILPDEWPDDSSD
ncbi:hypothetical protein EAY15_23445 [Vibrio anguillarum]|nr:hypothetical protein [Vibrio anguillarum]MBF4395898.1 hypothetical protein [Vibrio anguillarum]MBF4406122.1 hypothetical protein [Vibrio anguillarum]